MKQRTRTAMADAIDQPSTTGFGFLGIAIIAALCMIVALVVTKFALAFGALALAVVSFFLWIGQHALSDRLRRQ